MNLFKKTRIKVLIVVLGIYSLLIATALGGTSIYYLNSINSKLDTLYSERLVSIGKLSTANGSFGSMRVAFTKLLDRKYSEDYSKTLQSNNEILTKALREYSAISLDDKSSKLIEKTNKDYQEYYKYVDIVSVSKKNDIQIDVNLISTLAVLGDNVTKDVLELVNYENAKASSVYDASLKHNASAKKSLYIIFAIALAVITVTASVIYRVITNSVNEFTQILKVFSSGDLSAVIPKDERNEFGIMKRELALATDSIVSIINSIKDNTNLIDTQTASLASISTQMNSSSREVSMAIEEVSKGSLSQAEELISMVNVLNSFGRAIDNIVVSINGVDYNAKSVSIKANDSNNKLSLLVNSVDEMKISFNAVSTKINELDLSINKINEITTLINNIADQTNLLALNAAIEAARAGEAGKGFSVVADEIRKLAEQSKIASTNIDNLLSLISSETKGVVSTTKVVNGQLENQVIVISDSITSFKEIIFSIENIIPQIQNVTSEITSINKEKTDIIDKIETSSSVAEENSSNAEEIAATAIQMSISSETLSKSSQLLSDISIKSMKEVNKFKL